VAKKKKRDTKSVPSIWFVWLIIAILVLFVAWLWQRLSANKVPSGFGALIWGGSFLVFFLFGLVHYAQYILPNRNQDSWGDGFYLLLRPYLEGFSYIFTPQQQGSRRSARNESIPSSFRDMGAGIVKSHEVLALASGSAFSRDAGSGFVRLALGEVITDIIDLRAQTRTEEVAANTRDGIPLQTAVSVKFRVRQNDDHITDPDLLYPYDKDAIFQVTQLNSIDREAELRPWIEQISPQASGLLVTDLAQHTLNQLYQADAAGRTPLDDIKDRLRQQLSRQFDRYGVEILSVSIRPLGLPIKVQEQRIETWQADWERKIQIAQAAGNAEAVRRIRRARGRAQIEIIEGLLQNVEAAKRSDNANLTKIITLRAMDVLNRAMNNDVAQTKLPDAVITNLVQDATKQIEQMLERQQDSKESAP
jgi:hypothetical protein